MHRADRAGGGGDRRRGGAGENRGTRGHARARPRALEAVSRVAAAAVAVPTVAAVARARARVSRPRSGWRRVRGEIRGKTPGRRAVRTRRAGKFAAARRPNRARTRGESHHFGGLSGGSVSRGAARTRTVHVREPSRPRPLYCMHTDTRY